MAVFDIEAHGTHPSRIAFPNGRVAPFPPRNMSQIVSAKSSAWLSLLNPTLALAPPRLRVRALPCDWQYSMSLSKNAHLASFVPEKVPDPDAEQMLERSSKGAPPAPKKV